MSKRQTHNSDQDAQSGLSHLTIVGLLLMIIAVIVLQFLLRRSDAGPLRVQRTDFGALLNSTVPPDLLEGQFGQAVLPSVAQTAAPLEFTGRNSQPVQAWLSKPAGTDAGLAIVLIPDTVISQDGAQQLAQTMGTALAGEQIVTLAVELPTTESLSDQLSRVVSAVDYLHGTTEFADQPIMLLGTGLGGYQAIQASASVPVDGLVTVGAWLEPAVIYARLQERDAEVAKQFLRLLDCSDALLPDACLQQLSIVETVQADLPTLIIQSTTDPLTPVSQAELLAEQLAVAAATTVVLPNEGSIHDVFAASTDPVYAVAWKQLVDWLDQQSIKSPSGPVNQALPQP